MSRTITPPRPPAPGTADALFAEARRRRRRRRLAGLAVVLALAAAAASAFIVARPERVPAPGDTGRDGPTAVGTAHAALAGSLAWVDGAGRLHLGDLATGAQRVVGRSKAYPAIPLVQAGGHLYWAAPAGARVVVQELNPATGRVRSLGPGRSIFSVFTSADGRHVFVAPTATEVVELPAGASGGGRKLALPRGWYLPYGGSTGVARGGFLVESGGQTTGRHTVMAVWNPRTGALKVIGRDFVVWAAATPPGARYSLLAWSPAECSGGQNCPIRITNTATGSTQTVRSPRHYGFAFSAAFSPDGKQLAVFVNTDYQGNGAVLLALADTRTGAMRPVRHARLQDVGNRAWALWLPDGRHLIAGGYDSSYAVNTATLSARPLYFIPGRKHSQDINYTTVFVPPRH